MIRKLMASSALLALLSAGAITVAQAQTDTGTQPPAATQEPAAGTDATAPAAGADTAAPAAEEQPVQTEIAKEAPTLTPEQPTIATAFIGRSVYSSEDPQSDNIGEVNDLIIGSDGMITHAVVGVGGFLGIGEKDVAVPFDQLRVVQDENADVRLIYAATREQLEAAEAFDRSAFDPEERAQEQEEQADEAAGGGTTGEATTGAATTGGAMTGDAATEPAADANQTGEAQTEQQEPAAVITDAAPAETEQQTAATTPAAPPPAEDQAATDTAAPAVAGAGGFVSFSADQMRASRLMGQEIYGAEGESIGEVSDLVLQEDGSTRAAIIDVGGFLGIGEKRVAIPFNEIQVTAPAEMQATGGQAGGAATTDPATGGAATTAPATGDPAAGGNQAGTADPAAGGATGAGGAAGAGAGAAGGATDEPRLTINMTREQLEQLPEWQDPAQQAADQNAADQAATGAAGTATTPDQTAAGTTPGQTGAAGGATGAATDPNAAPGAGGAATENQYQPVTQELTADNLMGAPVYGPNEENLGEVGDVVFDMNGQIQAVVVDVGGFLGIGEKPVAMQFDALQVQRGDTGDFRLMANATQEQLEGAPSYEEDAAGGGAAGGDAAATGGTATGGTDAGGTDAGGTGTTVTPAPAPAPAQ